MTSSTLGVAVADIAYPLAILTMTGSPARAGLFAAVQAIAMLAAGLPAGSLADRFDPRTIVLVTEARRVGVTVEVVLALAAGWLSLPLLLAAGTLLGIGYAVRAVAYAAPFVFTAVSFVLALAATAFLPRRERRQPRPDGRQPDDHTSAADLAPGGMRRGARPCRHPGGRSRLLRDQARAMARALARSLIIQAPTVRGDVIMHPEIAPTIAAQHHQSLRREAARSRRMPARNRSRGFPRHPLGWSVSWSRTILSADATQRQGSSLVIIISARRASARSRSHSAI